MVKFVFILVIILSTTVTLSQQMPLDRTDDKSSDDGISSRDSHFFKSFLKFLAQKRRTSVTSMFDDSNDLVYMLFFF